MKKVNFRSIRTVLIGGLITLTFVFAQQMGAGERTSMQFIDENRDGLNDWFRDANGDGINDVDLKSYPHAFPFEDKNGDGKNDRFVDEDGDGVNDLSTSFVDYDGDKWNDNIIDADHDWINDITGTIYNRRSLFGGRYGAVWEERGMRAKDFVDENGDGQCDQFGAGAMGHRRMDRFVDTDGDGVSDGRAFDRHRRGPGNQRKNR